MKLSRKISEISGLQLFQLIRYTVVILIGILFAKSQLSTDTIGYYETFLLIAGLFSMFWTQGIIKALLPLTNESKDDYNGRLFANTFLLLLVISILACVIIYLSQGLIEKHLLQGIQIPYLNYLILYILFSGPSVLVEYIYLSKNQGKKIVKYGLTVFSIQLLLVALPPFVNLSIELSIIGLTITTLIKFIWSINLLAVKSYWKFESSTWSHLLVFSAPLIISTFLMTSARYIDGFIITSKFTQSEYAIFRYGAKELPLVMLLANSLSLSMISKFASENINNHLILLKKQAHRLGTFLFPVSIVLVLLSHWLFPIVFNHSFQESATIFNVYLLLIICRLIFPQTILLGKQMNKQLMIASFFELVINVSLSIWFANLFGIVGVAYATIIANIFEKVYLTSLVSTKLKIKVSSYFPWKQNISMSTILIVVFFIVENIIYK